MKSKILLILFFVLTIAITKAQASNEEAVATFQLAQSEFDKSDFQGAIIYLDRVEVLTPEAKAKTSYLKARCYYNLISVNYRIANDTLYNNCFNNIKYYSDSGKDDDKKSELLKIKIVVEGYFDEKKKGNDVRKKIQAEKQRITDGVMSEVAQGYLTIGNYKWSIVNLSVTSFRNGDQITVARTPDEFNKAAEKHKSVLCSIGNGYNGILYNSYAISDRKGLAPMGWHLPSEAEMNNFNQYWQRGGNDFKDSLIHAIFYKNDYGGLRWLEDCSYCTGTKIVTMDEENTYYKDETNFFYMQESNALDGCGYFVRCVKDE